MDKATARDILRRARPWAKITDAEEQTARAAQPELEAFARQQTEFNSRVHEEFSGIPVPKGLRDQILARPKIVEVPKSSWGPVRPLLALAAALLLLGYGLFYFLTPRENTSLQGFRSRMVGFALRDYRMDLTTNNLPALRTFLASKGGPAEFSIPPRLLEKPLKGGAKLSWQGKPVSMVCFDWDGKDILYMFVLDEPLGHGSRQPGPAPETLPLKRLSTITWSADGKTYLLAGAVPESSLAELVKS